MLISRDCARAVVIKEFYANNEDSVRKKYLIIIIYIRILLTCDRMSANIRSKGEGMKSIGTLFLVMLIAINIQAFDDMNINLFLGQKSLDKDDWEPVDQHPEYGIHFDFKEENWPVNMVVGLLYSHKADNTRISGFDARVKSTTMEFDVGIKKIFAVNENVNAFVGGGLLLVNAEAVTQITGLNYNDSADDSALGAWINTGIYWMFDNNINLGVQARYSKAKVTIDGTSAEAGGTHIGVLVGYRF